MSAGPRRGGRRAGFAALMVAGLSFAADGALVRSPVHAGGVRATVWVADSLARVQRLDAPGSRTSAALSAARNEYEVFQVVVTAPPQAGLKNVNATVSDLVGPGIIPRRHVRLYRAQYVPVRTRSRFQAWRSPNPPGEWPDALIPFDVPGGAHESSPFSVEAGQNQPVWVEVYVPPGTAPGTYAGTVTVIADGVDPVAVPVTLTVWGFTLPERPSLASDFGTYDTWFSIAAQHSAGATNPALREHLYAALSQHRLGIGVAGLDPAMDAWMARRSFILVPPDATDAELARIKAHFDARGWGGLLAHYIMDEPRAAAQYDALRNQAPRWRRLGIPVMTTIQNAAAWKALDGFVDIWVAVFYEFVFRREEIAARIRRGERVWSYTAGVQPDEAPTWLLDYDLIHYRVVPWLNYRTGATGLLYWATAAWDQGDAWTNTGPHNQDGVLFYPGAGVGAPNAAIPSARLKAIRDGLEDYEYLAELAAAGGAGPAIQLAGRVGSAWDRWSRDPRVLAAAREAAAARIVELRASRPGGRRMGRRGHRRRGGPEQSVPGSGARAGPGAGDPTFGG